MLFLQYATQHFAHHSLGQGIAISESDSAVYVVGHTEGNLDAELNSGGYDMCLLKFDLAGVQQ